MSRIVVLRIECASCEEVTEVAIGCHQGAQRACTACGRPLRVESSRVLAVVTLKDRRKAPRDCPHA